MTTSYSPPDENTLGVSVGARARSRGATGTTGVAKALTQASQRGATLGTGYLGIGSAIISGAGALYGLVLFAARWDDYPSVLPAIVAWALFIVTFVATSVSLSVLGDRVPAWLFPVYLALLAAVVAFDFAAIWSLDNIGAHATSSMIAGFGLLFVVTFRPAREVLLATGVLAAAFIAAIVLTTPLTADTVPVQVGAVAIAVLPPAIGVYIVGGFRRMVQLELDRVLVQSTVSAPRFAVGMLASEELARLDLAAEELLNSVATGTTALPLAPKIASVAASLATELRLHLIEGRRETWLFHAVTESEILGKAVTLTDRGNLAGLLDPAQRDGLLSAAWLLVSDTAKPSATRTVQISVGPVAASAERLSANKIVVPIVITTTEIPRNRVDPAAWDSIRKVGRYSDSTENSSLRVDIECLVDNPAKQ
ncbi:hypothetical protein [Glaciihabitans sp. dw_435]|uniref:hypothetical protein n=1 Tax=Glaciihabitans sp. dw_435 TaxID=2720081 RepID=UPI001BD3BE6C|nr:hypothetical protein [Glaciihabitans sp. dw_435]